MKKLIHTLFTVGKVALKSRPVGKPCARLNRNLIILGNGPSLSETIENYGDILKSNDTMAVNFAANTGEFFRLKPRHYVLADPHFFQGRGKDRNVDLLWENISKADWPLTLHVPSDAKLPTGLSARSQSMDVRRFNMTPGEGYDSVCFPLFRKGLAMPRPRNVLIPALMEGVREGYEEIYIAGADHTWPHTLYVDDRNRVVTVQPHYYKEEPAELDRIAEVYAGVRIHQILESMAIAFRSYHTVRRFAEKNGVYIYNSTPGSLIDAFPRRDLPK